MIFDNSLILSGGISAANAMTGQAVNGAGNILSTNTIDHGPQMVGGAATQPGDLAAGEGIRLNLTVLSAPTVGTSVTVQLIQADDAALSTNVQVICATDAIPIASLPVGAQVQVQIDPTAPYVPKRYIGLRYVNVGAIATASYFAALLKDAQSTRTVDKFKTGYVIV